MSDAPKNAPKGLSQFKGPTAVRYRDAARFLWGDAKSGEVADVIYGRNEAIGTLIYKLKPGGFFRSSDTWKSFFDQHRFYFVLKGEVAIQDPSTGEVAVARAGEAVHWRGAKWHFGYNFTAEETWVLDWYAPQERPPHVTEIDFGTTKPKFESEKAGRFDLLGRWPDSLASSREQARSTGGMITVRREDALPFIFGSEHPVLEQVFVSSKELTAGTIDLMAGARSENRSNPGHKVMMVRQGTLHVYLPDSFDWFELDQWDLVYLPPQTRHQYWNYGSQPLSLAFMTVPAYA